MRKVKQIVKQKVTMGSRVTRKSKNLASKSGVPGETRTHDLLLRRQPLCPTELQGQVVNYSNLARAEGMVKMTSLSELNCLPWSVLDVYKYREQSEQ